MHIPFIKIKRICPTDIYLGKFDGASINIIIQRKVNVATKKCYIQHLLFTDTVLRKTKYKVFFMLGSTL